jgi:hypothetical protein
LKDEAEMARIYQTTEMGEAQIRVALVSRGEADLFACRVGNYGMAQGDSLWFITRDKQGANTRVCFTSIGMAEVKVCFVDSQSEAGWQKEHRYKGRFL